MADVLTERQKQILLKADEICNSLTPAALNYVTIHDAVMKMAEYVDSLPAKSSWVKVCERKPEVDTEELDLNTTVSKVVFVRMENGYSSTAYYDYYNSEWRDVGTNWRIKDPVEWMDIPE